MLARPADDEYVEYYRLYVNRVPKGNILDIIAAQIPATAEFLGVIDEQKALYRYAPEKWSIKEVVGHVIDVERLFQYRAWAISRNDTALPGMEQDDYVAHSNFDDRALADLIEDYRLTRLAGLSLFKGLDAELASRRGTANGVEFSVRSFPYILAGHNIHHMGVIKERYL